MFHNVLLFFFFFRHFIFLFFFVTSQNTNSLPLSMYRTKYFSQSIFFFICYHSFPSIPFFFYQDVSLTLTPPLSNSSTISLHVPSSSSSILTSPHLFHPHSFFQPLASTSPRFKPLHFPQNLQTPPLYTLHLGTLHPSTQLHLLVTFLLLLLFVLL